MQTIPYKDFKHGMRATCEVNGKKVEGKIAIDSKWVSFCSDCDQLDGTLRANFGYKYAWSFLSIGEEDFYQEHPRALLTKLTIYPTTTIPYSRFKHGQRVTCKIKKRSEYPKYISDAKISIDEDGSLFICQNMCRGLSADNKLGYEYSWNITIGKKDFTEGGDDVTELKILDRTMDDLEIGDEINTPTGNKTVLAVCGKLFFLSKTSLPDQLDDGYTLAEIMDRSGWILKQEVFVDPIKEFTLQEVADKMGIAVDKLRIKD